VGQIMSEEENSVMPEGDKEPSRIPNEKKPLNKKSRHDLTISEVKRGARLGDTYVRATQSHPHHFRKVGPGYFVAMPESDRPASPLGKGYRSLKKVLIGRPIETAEEVHQRLNKVKALAVFGSDPISSCAYATEASLMVLMAAGTGALHISLYTAVAVALLLSMVAFSYRQTVYAYPHGGGSYNVSRQNLGVLPGLVAAAALMIDYVMTVAVSIVAGSYAVTSAITASGSSFGQGLPASFNLNVLLSLFFIAIITVGNLRGIRQSGTIFAIPTYLFVVSIVVMLIVGLFKAFTGTLEPATPPPVLQVTQPVTLWLILRAFSAGAIAMSGTEAVSNGVPVFQKPESRNAARTLTIMATLLGVFYIGVSYLTNHMSLVPGDESIISQVAHAVFGVNAFYVIFQIATIGILVVAANTAFADFPRLSSILARDGYMPHQFTDRGDRLAFSTGIIALGVIAALLVVAFQGNVNSLIHLYAVGVFLAFSMSDSGMVVHWWKTRGPRWKTSIIINGADAILTSSILLIVAVTKFMLGAWIVVILVPIIVVAFLMIHRHYSNVASQLSIVPGQLPSPKIDQLVIVPVDDINYSSLRAIAFARTIADDAIILHVATDPESAEKIKQKVSANASDLKLVVVESPFRSLVRPLLAYVDAVHSQKPDAFVTIVLPQFITAHWWERFLHERTAARLHRAFEKHPNVAVVMVPYLLEK